MAIGLYSLALFLPCCVGTQANTTNPDALLALIPQQTLEYFFSPFNLYDRFHSQSQENG